MKKKMNNYSQLLLRKVGGGREREEENISKSSSRFACFSFFLTSGFHVTKVRLLIQENLGGCQKGLAVFSSI